MSFKSYKVKCVRFKINMQGLEMTFSCIKFIYFLSYLNQQFGFSAAPNYRVLYFHPCLKTIPQGGQGETVLLLTLLLPKRSKNLTKRHNLTHAFFSVCEVKYLVAKHNTFSHWFCE